MIIYTSLIHRTNTMRSSAYFPIFYREELVMSLKNDDEKFYFQCEIIAIGLVLCMIGYSIGIDIGIDPVISVLGIYGFALTIWHYHADRDNRRLRKQMRHDLKSLQKMGDPMTEIEAIESQKRENHE